MSVSSRCRLTRPNDGDPPPSLHGHYTRFITTYGAVRPWPTHRYFRPRGGNRLCLFAYHRRTGSQVPHESPNESHAPSTPDIAWPVGRLPAMLVPEHWQSPGFDVT